MSDYLKIVYNTEDRPLTDYPEKLVNYLFEAFKLKKGLKFLEPGCGRGEHLNHFKGLGLEVYGLDISPEAAKLSPNLNISTFDLESGKMPFEDNYFDVIYSKSFLEHIRIPEVFLKEAFRVLKPGGVIISLVPDWESQYQKFYDDYTHVSPFTSFGLNDIQLAVGFTDVEVYKLRQLPIVWKYPFLNYLCSIIALFVPVRTEIPFLRWSREVMLVGKGIKPPIE